MVSFLGFFQVFYTWGVPDDPCKKSICRHDFGDSVRSEEGFGTFKRLPKAPISLVRHFEGGPQRAKWPKLVKKGQKDNFSKTYKNPKIF